MNSETVARRVTTAERILELIESVLVFSGHSHSLLLVKLVRIAIRSAKIKARK